MKDTTIIFIPRCEHLASVLVPAKRTIIERTNQPFSILRYNSRECGTKHATNPFTKNVQGWALMRAAMLGVVCLPLQNEWMRPASARQRLEGTERQAETNPFQSGSLK